MLTVIFDIAYVVHLSVAEIVFVLFVVFLVSILMAIGRWYLATRDFLTVV